MKTETLDGFQAAYSETSNYHEDNALMLTWHMRRMVQRFEELCISSLLSLGIGHQIVARNFVEAVAGRLNHYVILEGSRRILEEFRSSVEPPPQVELVHTLFEDYHTDLHFDAIELGFVLEHVDDPASLLVQFKQFLSPDGSMFIAVPNARSLHRQVGHAAGILDDLYRLSACDFQQGHKRFFDLESLSQAVEDSGLKIVHTEGIFLKPITTSQLQTLDLPGNILEAFCQVGVDHPDLCNGIVVQATHSE